MTFQLTEAPLESLGPMVPPPSCGAVVVFHGLVRNHNEGKAVEALDYSAYPELALKEGQRILEEAQARFGLVAARAVHRIGALRLGERAVVVEAATAHREEGFEACRWIIDEIKARVPVWKQEHYLDGSRDWVACHRCAHPGHRH